MSLTPQDYYLEHKRREEKISGMVKFLSNSRGENRGLLLAGPIYRIWLKQTLSNGAQLERLLATLSAHEIMCFFDALGRQSLLAVLEKNFRPDTVLALFPTPESRAIYLEKLDIKTIMVLMECDASGLQWLLSSLPTENRGHFLRRFPSDYLADMLKSCEGYPICWIIKLLPKNELAGVFGCLKASDWQKIVANSRLMWLAVAYNALPTAGEKTSFCNALGRLFFINLLKTFASERSICELIDEKDEEFPFCNKKELNVYLNLEYKHIDADSVNEHLRDLTHTEKVTVFQLLSSQKQILFFEQFNPNLSSVRYLPRLNLFRPAENAATVIDANVLSNNAGL